MAKRQPSKQAKACISEEIKKHCHKKSGKCRKAKERSQAVAIAYSICRREGFRSIKPKR